VNPNPMNAQAHKLGTTSISFESHDFQGGNPLTTDMRQPSVKEHLLILRESGGSKDLTSSIAQLPCGEELKAGLNLLNGNWEAAHQRVQTLKGSLAAHWHGIIHRREPDFGNAKYWFRQVPPNSLFASLLASAHQLGKAHLVAHDNQWDPLKFIDCCADAGQREWTRVLDPMEVDLLLDYCLEREP